MSFLPSSEIRNNRFAALPEIPLASFEASLLRTVEPGLAKEGLHREVDQHVDEAAGDLLEDGDLQQGGTEGRGCGGDGMGDLDGEFDQLDDDVDLQGQDDAGADEEAGPDDLGAGDGVGEGRVRG